MIETEQTVEVAAPIALVWTHARDIKGWAGLMPGLVDCAILNNDDSRWTLKVGVGALLKTVTVLVHVDRWAGPAEVDFSYRLENEPVSGGGLFRARPLGRHATEVVLRVRVEGGGPMAPMWEAMGKPLLPKFASAFADQFRARIEQAASPVDAQAPPDRPAWTWAALVKWLRRLFATRRGI